MSTFTAQSVRIFATQMNSVFLWSFCFSYSASVTNTPSSFYSQFFLLQVKGLGVPFRMQVHDSTC